MNLECPKFPFGFVSFRAARRSRSGMENHHWRCGFHHAIYFEIKRTPSYCGNEGCTAHERSSHIAVSISWLGTSVMTESDRDTRWVMTERSTHTTYLLQLKNDVFDSKFNDFNQLVAMIGHTCISCCFYQLLVLNLKLRLLMHDVYFVHIPNSKKEERNKKIIVRARYCPSKRWKFSSPPLSWWSWIRTFNRRRIDGFGWSNSMCLKWLYGFKTAKLNGKAPRHFCSEDQKV